jgi:hypothetical protein
VTGVSFIVPVHNGVRWLDTVLSAILAQADGRPMEVLVVEDGSRDGSRDVLSRYVGDGSIRLIDGPRRGAAAALNAGIRAARYPIVCQVDQDVILEQGWMVRLAAALEEPHVAAAQGYYVTPPDGTAWARVMGLDLEDRYRRLLGRDVDHVCTGNTAYRADALREVGLFDESLGYGYDNDISYRLVAFGYRLVICPDARSHHKWRDGWWSYTVQQYGFGYGRLDLVAKHRRRATGDDVSQLPMMLHAPLMLLALAAAGAAGASALLGISAIVPLAVSAVILAALAVDRCVAGIGAARAFRNAAGLLFVPVHLVRDLAWAAAIVMWSIRRALGIAPHPSDSMVPRDAVGGAGAGGGPGRA